MIRSNFAIIRLVVIPYAVLLILYLLVVGGGGAWLYHQVKVVETDLLINEILAAIEPLAKKMTSSDDVVSLIKSDRSLLVNDVEALFVDYPELLKVTVRDQNSGLDIINDHKGMSLLQNTLSLPANALRASMDAPATDRLHNETEAIFYIRFDLSSETEPLIRMDFGFDRALLLEQVNAGLKRIRNATIWFGVIGWISILLALMITVQAMRSTRKIENHFQKIYQRASMTEMAAQLVHDLRNPLMALRANVKALIVSPDDADEIIDELDQDIVKLNEKLSGFLDLTRHHDDAFESVDLEGLIDDAIRLAEPVLKQHNLTIEKDIAENLPQINVQKEAIRDVLLNVILNAAQSGQKEGEIVIRVCSQETTVEIKIEDRGNGVPVEHLSKIFDAFYTTRGVDGNGLGLAIVRRIVEAHQGQVNLENRKEGGARFTITLPLVPKEVPHWWKKLKKTSPT